MGRSMRGTWRSAVRGGVWLLALAAIGAATPAAAGVNDREERQRDRVAQGVADGSLTQPEVHRLARQQKRIEVRERRMRADDGRLGWRERARLDDSLDRASARIHYARNDGQTR